MKYIILVILLVLNISYGFSQPDDEIIIHNIYQEQLSTSPIYENLRYLTKEIGNRINGSPGLATAIEYARQLMIKYQFDTVYLQPVMVPQWIRGNSEIVRILNSPSLGCMNLNGIALGNSVGTGKDGIIGNVVEINSLEDLEKVDSNLIKGKIVFLNQAADNGIINILEAYARIMPLRIMGTSLASSNGAKAVIFRSISTSKDNIPHTGTMRYENNIKKIPAIAISTNDADFLSNQIKREPNTEVYLEMHCESLENTISYNVIGEIEGNQFPGEVILVGGHIDSWDLGEGAHDDGAGCLQAIEVLRQFRALNIQPKHTLRAILWVDEENGLSGSKVYAMESRQNGTKHIAALESDFGGFLPLGFFIDTDDEIIFNMVLSWKRYFEPYQLFQFSEGPTGFDIEPLKESNNLLLGLSPNLQKYSSIWHSEKDVFEAVDKRELQLGAAAMTSIVYLLDKYGIK